MKLAYLDSCVYIAHFEGLPIYKTILARHLAQLAQGGWLSCISEIVILEVLAKPLQNQQDTLAQHYQKLFQTLRILENYPQLFTDALHIMQTEHLKIIDALHVAIAVHHDCQLFVSSDPHFRLLKTIRPHWIDLSGVVSSA